MDAGLDDASVDDVSQCEDRIVSQWRQVSAAEKSQLQERVNEIVRPLGLQTRLLVLERANSIALCFICMTLSALTSLRDQWRNGQLRDVISSLFTFLSGTTGTVRVKRLTWPLTDYERCSEFFISAQGKPKVYLNSNRPLGVECSGVTSNFAPPLQENHLGPLLQNNIGVSRTFYWWGLRTEAP